MTNQTPESVIAEALIGAGLSDMPDEFDSNIHSWRCEHPERYGRCKCFEETVADLVAALRAANMLRESAVPDAATELRAERDAALAAIGRVRAVADQWNGTPDYQPSEYDKGRVDQRHDMTEQLLAALDGAPEPEWEYGHREGGKVYDEPSTPLAAAKILNSQPVRRRKAGPWLPVEGESNGG